MAELATIARPYAQALYQASRADAPGTAQWLDALAAVAAEPQLLSLAAHPKVGEAQVFDLVAGVAGVPLPDQGRNFLRTIIENGRLAALPFIAAQYRALMNAAGGSSDAVVHSAFPIGDAELADLRAALEQRFGRRLNLSVREDSSLIGGVRVVVGDEVLDTSVRARLEQMKVALTA